MRGAKSFLLICFLLWSVSAFAEAERRGRITSQVNFREAPSRSAPRIEVLAPGTDVLVLRKLPAGWYSVVHRGRSGFVHQDNVKLVPAQETHGDLSKRAGAVCIFIGAALISIYFFPILPRAAAVLCLSFLGMLLLDLAFSLGMLYSLFFVSLALLAIASYLKRQTNKKSNAFGEWPGEIKKAA